MRARRRRRGRRRRRAPAGRSEIPPHIGSARFSAAARSVSGSEPSGDAEVAHRRLQVERRDVVGGARDPRLAPALRRSRRDGSSARRTCGTRGRARRQAARRGRRARAPRSVAAASRRAAFQPVSCGRKTRSIAACTASRREFVPMSSNVFLSREPWKRSMRTRSATSSSRQPTSPPSPSAKRFFVGKKLNVEQIPVCATPSAPKACAASSISGSPSAASSPERAPAARRDGPARSPSSAA